jgi:DNA-directed RNA polymerase specialized sigma24 family protein
MVSQPETAPDDEGDCASSRVLAPEEAGPLSDQQLARCLVEALSSDNHAVIETLFTQLVERHGESLLRAIRHWIGKGRWADADDLYQQTLLRGWQKRSTFRGGNFLYWLRSIAWRLIEDGRRAHDAKHMPLSFEVACEPEEVGVSDEEVAGPDAAHLVDEVDCLLLDLAQFRVRLGRLLDRRGGDPRGSGVPAKGVKGGRPKKGERFLRHLADLNELMGQSAELWSQLRVMARTPRFHPRRRFEGGGRPDGPLGSTRSSA